jgi:hypothetical protein
VAVFAEVFNSPSFLHSFTNDILDPLDPNATIKVGRRSTTNPLLPSALNPSPFHPQHHPPQHQQHHHLDMSHHFPSPPSTQTHSSATNTPMTEHSEPMMDAIRCICGSVEERPMIQCEHCSKLSHIKCVFGIYAEQGTTELPMAWTCGFCTGQVRHPHQPQQHSFGGEYGVFGQNQSPLGHKGMMSTGPGAAFI